MQSFVRLVLLSACALGLLSAQNSPITWSSILPGGGYDVAVATVVDAAGDVWVAGHSYGKYEAFGPNEPFQSLNKGASDIFLVKYRPFPDGSARVLFFTWLGGGGVEELVGMKLDNSGRVVLAGTTASNDWPIAGNAAQNIFGGDVDSFVAILDPNAGGAASLFYSTYFGGTGRETAKVLAVSPTGRIAVGGSTAAEDVPFVNGGAQPNKRGGIDIFLFTINDSVGGGFSYATYLGGAGTDTVTGMLWDANNRLWFTGNTGSEDFPVTDNAYNQRSSGFFDAYLVGINPNVSGLAGYEYATLLGGQGNDEGRGLAQLADGTFVLTGLTFSQDFPLYGQFAQGSLSGACDLFLTRLDPRLPAERQVLYSSYYGGTGTDIPYSMSLVGANSVAIVGYSMSGQFPVSENAVQKTRKSGFSEGLIVVMSLNETGGFDARYASYFGGTSTDVINSVAADPVEAGALIFAGYTTSADLLTTDGSIRPNPNPAPSAFVARLLR